MPILKKKFLWPLYFFVLLVLYALAPRTPALTNPDSRFSLTRAVVHEGTFAVDHFLDTQVNLDWSSRMGHFYTNKAPGVSLLAVPFYFVFLKLEQAFGIDVEDWRYRNMRWIDVFVTAVPSVLLAYLFLQFLLFVHPKKPQLPIALAMLAYSVGTIAFPFSTMFWAHQTAAFFAFASFFFLYKNKYIALAGFCFAMAVLTEYSAAILAPGYLYLLFRKKQPLLWKQVLLFALGGLPVLIFFGYYHYSCFGSPLALAPKFQNPVLGLESGTKLFGVLALPAPKVVFALLFSTSRGLFYISPVLLFAVYGFSRMWRQVALRPVVVFCAYAVISFLLFNASYNGWHGGGSSGPRYLVPMLPFFAVGLAWVMPSLWYRAAVLVSVVNMAVIVAVDQATLPKLNVLVHVYSGLFSEPRFVVNTLLILFSVLVLWLLAKRGVQSAYGK